MSRCLEFEKTNLGEVSMPLLSFPPFPAQLQMCPTAPAALLKSLGLLFFSPLYFSDTEEINRG